LHRKTPSWVHGSQRTQRRCPSALGSRKSLRAHEEASAPPLHSLGTGCGEMAPSQRGIYGSKAPRVVFHSTFLRGRLSGSTLQDRRLEQAADLGGLVKGAHRLWSRGSRLRERWATRLMVEASPAEHITSDATTRCQRILPCRGSNGFVVEKRLRAAAKAELHGELAGERESGAGP